MRSIEIIPTNTCPPDFEELARRSSVFASFSPHIQLDVSDGKFSPVISWPYQSGQWDELNTRQLPLSERVLYEAHLMIEEPQETGELLIGAGARRVMGHIEAFAGADAARAALQAWRKRGAETGLAILFHTPLEKIEKVISECDVVLMMSIATIGKQGAAYEPGILERIKTLRNNHSEILIAIDGGVSLENIADLARAGASRFGVGSAISKAEDPKAAYQALKVAAENALQ